MCRRRRRDQVALRATLAMATHIILLPYLFLLHHEIVVDAFELGEVQEQAFLPTPALSNTRQFFLSLFVNQVAARRRSIVHEVRRRPTLDITHHPLHFLYVALPLVDFADELVHILFAGVAARKETRECTDNDRVCRQLIETLGAVPFDDLLRKLRIHTVDWQGAYKDVDRVVHAPLQALIARHLDGQL